MATVDEIRGEIQAHVDGLLAAVGDLLAEVAANATVPTEAASESAPPADTSSTATGAGSTTSTEDTSAGAPSAPEGMNAAQQDIVAPAPETAAEEAAEETTETAEVTAPVDPTTALDAGSEGSVSPPDTAGL